MNDKEKLVNKINDLLNQSDLKVQSYRKYVTKSGKNVKFLLKVLSKMEDSAKYSKLYKLLNELSQK